MDDLRDAIERAFNRTGLKAYYADIEIRQSHILGKIADMIFHTQFGIFDISNPMKPNVFLELGFAMAAKKPYYLICKKGTDIPANLEGLDRIEYESYKQLSSLIKELIVEGEISRLKERLSSEVFSENEVIRNSIRVYQSDSSRMHHATGISVKDRDAENHTSWHVGASMPCPIHIMYGPYQSLPKQGPYKAIFRIKIDDNSNIKEILHIDVISNSNPLLNTHSSLRGIHFKCPNKYQLFGVEFNYLNEPDVEYRVIKLSQERQVWVDYVAIVPVLKN